MKMYTKRTSIKASKDYADLKGMDFTKARDLLTKDGFYEHEYGDKDNNNGYAVYRKGDKEVELQYRWIPGKRKGDAHAGKVTNVYVDDNIYGACGKKSVKASNEGRSDLIYVIMVNGNPVAKGSYDAMVKKSYTYNYPVQMLKFPKAKLNSLIKMAKDAHRPDPLKFAVNRFINDNTSEYDSLNSATKVRSRRAIKASTAPKRYEVAIDRGENEPLLVKFFDNQDDAFNYADSVHDRGFAVRITDNETGETEELGEFESYWNTMTDVESCDNSVTASELSLNLSAEPRWEEWVAYGYDVTGEDVTTDSIDFQDDFRSFITDMFRSYPEIDTIDVYKRGSSENDEYFQTFTRDDVRDMLADAVWDIQHGNGHKNSVHSSKKIVCSIPQDDVVMYYYGKRIYMGGPGDLYYTILSLCRDDEVRFRFQEWCEHFGYTLSNDKSGNAEEISNLFCDIVYQLCTDDPYGVITGDDILDFEIFPVSYDTI